MHPRTRRGVPVPDAARELGTALTTVTSFQGAVQHADEKARTVLAVHGTVTALVVAQLTFLPPASALRGVVPAILAFFVAGSVFSAYQLLQALRPRITCPAGPNRFAFPSVAGSAAAIAPASVRQQCAEAHQVARLLAELAMRKHRHVRRALAGTGVLFLCGPVLLLVAGLA